MTKTLQEVQDALEARYQGLQRVLTSCEASATKARESFNEYAVKNGLAAAIASRGEQVVFAGYLEQIAETVRERILKEKPDQQAIKVTSIRIAREVAESLKFQLVTGRWDRSGNAFSASTNDAQRSAVRDFLSSLDFSIGEVLR